MEKIPSPSYTLVNVSNWLFSVKDTNLNINEKKQRDNILTKKVFPQNYTERLNAACFNTCIQDFSNSTLSHEENGCLSNCKRQVMNFYTDLTVDIQINHLS